jgi:hypothetical protein
MMGQAPALGRRSTLKNQHGDDRFRLGMSKQGKRAEEAAMISLTICRKKIIAKPNSDHFALAA